MPVKKKIKRNQTKYPALDKTFNLKTRSDLYDYDYINGYHDEETGVTIRALTESEKEYLNKFTEEYVNAGFKPRKKRVHKQKKSEHPKNINLRQFNKKMLEHIKAMTESLNNSDIANTSKSNLRRLISKFRNDVKKKIKREMKFIKDFYKKDSYDSNNSRNRCILTRAKAQGLAIGVDEIPENYSIEMNEEDKMIERLDLKKELENSEDNT